MRIRTKILIIVLLLCVAISTFILWNYNTDQKKTINESLVDFNSPFCYLTINALEMLMYRDEPFTFINLLQDIQKDLTQKTDINSLIPKDISEWFVFNHPKLILPNNIKIFRIDGKEAFIDKSTYDSVSNYNIEFNSTRNEKYASNVIEDYSKNEYFNKFLTSTRGNIDKKIYSNNLFFYKDKDNDRYLDIFKEIYNQERCRKCHGSEQNLRGVLRLTIPIESVYNQIDFNTIRYAIIIGLGILIMILLANLFIKHKITNPLKRLTKKMYSATSIEDFQDIKVNGNDEINEIKNAAINFISNFSKPKPQETFDTKPVTIEHSEQTTIINDIREGTMLACEIRGFKSELKNLDYDKQIELITLYLNSFKDLLTNNSGAIFRILGEKFIGIFQGKNHVENAITASVNMVQVLNNLNADSNIKIRLGIAIHRGNGLFGHAIERSNVEAIMVGTSINLALKLSDMAGDSTILITEAVLEKAVEHYMLKEIEPVVVDSYPEPIKLYAIVGIKA